MNAENLLDIERNFLSPGLALVGELERASM
jgi:hypothetical protein